MTINQNPKCFLDIAIDGQPVGRVIVELFADVCPRTCENFRLLCTGEMGMSKLSGRKLYYKGSCFHRIVKGFMVQGGDFEKGDGTGGESIYGLKFEDENFELRHDRPGLLSMANKGANSNGSQFFITTVPAPHIDGKNVVFGSVIHGFEVVKMIEKVETVGNFHPKVPIQISGCGELIAVIKKSEKKKKSESSSEESSSSSSEEESSSESESEKKKKKRKKKNKKHAKKKRKVSSEKNSKKEEEEKGEETGTCSVDPAEIPSIPPNKFLYRGSPLQDKQVKDQPEEIENRQEAKPKSPMRRRDRTGRKIKGRGAVRYHSRSRSHSRGTTPPHWRREQSRLTTLSQALNSMKADRISRTDEETKDENRLGTRDQNRFGADDEKRSRFDRRLNERPQKVLSEKFGPERDSSTKFERKESLKSRLEAGSDFGQKVAKRKRHDSSRSPVADTERRKERRVDRDRDVEKLTERTESPEERKKIAITPLATKSQHNKDSPHKRSKTVKHDEYDPFSKNDKGSDSEAELKGNKVQSALQRCKEREPSHSTQKPSSQKDDFHDLEKRGNSNNVSKDESNKETIKECNKDVALKCKNVESKYKMKQSHFRDEETSKHIEQRKAGFSPIRERHRTSRSIRRSHSREAPSKPKNVRSDSRNEKLRGRMSRSRDEKSASRERRMRSERNESYVQRLPSWSRGRSPNQSRFRRGEPFEGGRRQRSTSGSGLRNSRFTSGNSPVRLRDYASRESLSNKTLKRDDEKCGRLAWQPPMEIEYETQGGNENVSASQVAGTAKPTDIHSFHEQVINDNPQTAPDTDLSEKSMSMSSSGDEKANGFGKEKVNVKKDEIHSGTGTYKGDRSSSSDSFSESSSSERSKSLKRGPRDSDYDDGHVKDKRKKLVKRHQRKESDAAASSSDDEEAGKHKSLKPQNLENVKDTECDINSIPLPLGSSECGLETDFTQAPVLKEPRKLPDSQKAELSTGKSKCEGNVVERKCRRIEDKSEEMGTNSAVGNNSKVKSLQGYVSPRRARSPGRSRSSKRDRRSRSIRRNRSFRRRSRSGVRDRSLRRSRSNRRNRSRRSRSRGWERTRRSRSMRRDRSRRSRSGRRDRSRRSRSVRRDRSRRDRGRGRSRSNSMSISRKEGQRRGRSTRSRSASGSEKSMKRVSLSRKLSRGRRSNDAGRSSSSSSSSSS